MKWWKRLTGWLRPVNVFVCALCMQACSLLCTSANFWPHLFLIRRQCCHRRSLDDLLQPKGCTLISKHCRTNHYFQSRQISTNLKCQIDNLTKKSILTLNVTVQDRTSAHCQLFSTGMGLLYAEIVLHCADLWCQKWTILWTGQGQDRCGRWHLGWHVVLWRWCMSVQQDMIWTDLESFSGRVLDSQMSWL